MAIRVQKQRLICFSHRGFSFLEPRILQIFTNASGRIHSSKGAATCNSCKFVSIRGLFMAIYVEKRAVLREKSLILG